jgi:hypothetical protein
MNDFEMMDILRGMRLAMPEQQAAVTRAIRRVEEFRAFAEGFIEDGPCDCASRGWYGEEHDTACPVSQAEFMLAGTGGDESAAERGEAQSI